MTTNSPASQYGQQHPTVIGRVQYPVRRQADPNYRMARSYQHVYPVAAPAWSNGWRTGSLR